MEKRLIVFAVLSVAILIGWSILFPTQRPVEPPPGSPPAEEGRPADEERPVFEAPRELEEEEREAPALTVAAAVEETFVVETDLLAVEFTNRGGRIRSWVLKEFQTRGGRPLELVSQAGRVRDLLPLALDTDDRALAEVANAALYEVARERTGDGETVRFTWADGRGTEVVKELAFTDGDYRVGLKLSLIDRGRAERGRLTWGPGFQTRSAEDGAGGTFYYKDQIAWNLGGEVDREKKIKEEIAFAGNIRWAGIEDQYFTALLVPGDRSQVRIWPEPLTPGGEEEELTLPIVAVEIPEIGAQLFGGPKNYGMLKPLGSELDKSVWFSSIALFAAMARLLYWALTWIQTHIVSNWGVAIILTTVALRILLFPLNQFSMVRMKKMQVEMQRVQPKLNAIKKKYAKKKDAEARMKMHQEQQAVMQAEGINPAAQLSGCLPMLLQFPILIGFYDMLLAAVELRGAPFFGWIQDLTLKDPAYITPLLMGASMFAQQKMSTTKMGDPTQQRIMMMMPIMFTVMFLNMPSGLVLYWLANNVLGIGQQWLVNRFTKAA